MKQFLLIILLLFFLLLSVWADKSIETYIWGTMTVTIKVYTNADVFQAYDLTVMESKTKKQLFTYTDIGITSGFKTQRIDASHEVFTFTYYTGGEGIVAYTDEFLIYNNGKVMHQSITHSGDSTLTDADNDGSLELEVDELNYFTLKTEKGTVYGDDPYEKGDLLPVVYDITSDGIIPFSPAQNAIYYQQCNTALKQRIMNKDSGFGFRDYLRLYGISLYLNESKEILQFIEKYDPFFKITYDNFENPREETEKIAGFLKRNNAYLLNAVFDSLPDISKALIITEYRGIVNPVLQLRNGKMVSQEYEAFPVKDAQAYKNFISRIYPTEITQTAKAAPSNDPLLKKPAPDFSQYMLIVIINNHDGIYGNIRVQSIRESAQGFTLTFDFPAVADEYKYLQQPVSLGTYKALLIRNMKKGFELINAAK